MGLYASAEVIFGVPVVAWDEDNYDATPWWDEEREDWRKLPGELKVESFGHYDDIDQNRGILTLSRFPIHGRADCWSPKAIDATALRMEEFYRPEFWIAVRGAGLAREVERTIAASHPPQWHVVVSFA